MASNVWSAITERQKPGSYLNPPPEDTSWKASIEQLIDDNLTRVHNVGGRAAQNVGSMFSHPLDTLSGLGSTIKDVAFDEPMEVFTGEKANGPIEQRIDEFKKDYAVDPNKAIENAAGDVLGMYASGKILDAAGRPLVKKVIGPMTQALKDKAASMRTGLLERATGTGPKATAKLVEDTQAENKASADKHGTALEKHQADTREAVKENVDALKDHLDKIDDISKTRQDAKYAETLRKQLPKIIADTTEDVGVKIEKARHDALEEGNAKYNAVNPQLNPIEADQEAMHDARLAAAEAIKGSETKVPILEDMTKHIKNGDTFNYEDLQGYYSELGREISKGNLPGDVFHALDTLHESIGKEMQRIANSKGEPVSGAPKIKGEGGDIAPAYTTDLGKQLYESREYWRRMKQTFGDTSDAVTDRAGKELASTNPEFQKSQMSDYRRRLLGSFDPQIPIMLESIDEGNARLEAVPPKTEVPAYPKPPEPKSAGKAPTHQPKTISDEDIRAAKKKNIDKSAEAMRHRAMSISVYVTGYRSLAAIGRAMTGDLSALRALPAAVAEGVGMLGGMDAAANWLQSPKIVELLTKPTARDLAQIPPEMRGNLKVVVEAAQKRGIRVDPKLAAVVGAAVTPKGPAARKLEELRNGQPTQ